MSEDQNDKTEEWYKHQEHAYKLVGEYMYHFSSLESRINQAIEVSIGLDALDAAITLSNMSFSSKINTLRSLCSMHSVVDTYLSTPSQKTLSKVIGLADNDRNMIAHTPFFATDDGDVRFFRVTAKKELKVPQAVWSQTVFEEKCADLMSLSKEIEAIGKSLAKVRYNQYITHIPYPNSVDPKQHNGDFLSLSGLGGSVGGDHESPNDPNDT